MTTSTTYNRQANTILVSDKWAGRLSEMTDGDPAKLADLIVDIVAVKTSSPGLYSLGYFNFSGTTGGEFVIVCGEAGGPVSSMKAALDNRRRHVQDIAPGMIEALVLTMVDSGHDADWMAGWVECLFDTFTTDSRKVAS